MQQYGQFNPGNFQSVLEMLNQLIPNYGAMNNPAAGATQHASAGQPGIAKFGPGNYKIGPSAQPPPAPMPNPTPVPSSPQPQNDQWYGMNGAAPLGQDALASLGYYQP